MDRRVTSPTWGPPPPCKQALKVLFIAKKVFSTCPGGNYRWVPLERLIYLRPIFWRTKFAFYRSIILCVWVKELSNDISTELLTETAISS